MDLRSLVYNLILSSPLNAIANFKNYKLYHLYKLQSYVLKKDVNINVHDNKNAQIATIMLTT